MGKPSPYHESIRSILSNHRLNHQVEWSFDMLKQIQVGEEVWLMLADCQLTQGDAFHNCIKPPLLGAWLIFRYIFNFEQFSCLQNSLKVALQIVGRKFYKNTQKSSLYSQSILIFIHKPPAVESHPTTREIRYLLRPRSTLTENTVYFYMSSSLIYIHRQSFKHSVQ